GLLSLLPFASAIAQDQATQCAEAILRKDAAAAARAAAQATAPASRARLQAALLPKEQRPAAMLAVARFFPDDAEADQAILAGSAAILVLFGRGSVVPGLEAWTDSEDESRYAVATEPLAPVILGLRDAAAARKAKGGDRAVLQQAERLL